jgi:DNA-binding CsgD family transcriptional regulator
MLTSRKGPLSTVSAGYSSRTTTGAWCVSWVEGGRGAVELGWPLLGRDDELAWIRATLHGSAGPGLVFSGAPGVGRTRLLRAAADEAGAAGYRVGLIAGTRAAASVPLGAMACLLPAGVSPTQHLDAFRVIADRLRTASSEGTLMLAVDDAHALDDVSAALVHQLALSRAAVVVATVRRGEPAPDAVVALWKDDLARRVEVRPLPESTIDELIDRALPAEICGPARARLRGLAAGNPLYLRELLVDAVDGGTLRHRNGVWQWYGSLRGGGRLGELVEAQLRACHPAGRAVVELVALGEPLPLAALDSDPGLDDADRAGLLEVVADRRRNLVRLTPPVYGEVVRARLGPIRARTAYRVLLAWLRNTPRRRSEDLLRLASWQLAAGDSPDPAILLPAAGQAAIHHDLDLAERLASAAVGAHDGKGAEDPAAVRLLAEVLRWQGRAQESLALLSGGPPASVDPAERTRWQVSRASSLYWGLARRTEAEQALRAAADDLGTGPARAMMLLFEGRCTQAVEAARSVFEATQVPVDARLWAYTAASLAAAHMGHVELALGQADCGLRLAEAGCGDSLLGAAHLRIARACALLFAGRLTQARAQADHGYRAAVATGEHGLVAAWAGLRGMVGQIQGDLVVAAASLREAVALGEQHDPTGLHGYHLAILAGVLAQSGDLDRARAALDQADASKRPIHRLYAPHVELNRARLAAAAGEPNRAIKGALRAATIATEAGQRCLEAFALYDAARYGAADQVRERLDELASAVDSQLVAGYAETVRALAEDEAARLEAAAARLEQLGALLAAAHAAMAASRAHRRAGRQRAADDAHEQALMLDLRCRGTGAPWRAIGDAAALTPREYEIALLAAQRASSADIARHLHLSVRTVNNHLHRVYAKLGISGRAQLAAVLQKDLSTRSATGHETPQS